MQGMIVLVALGPSAFQHLPANRFPVWLQVVIGHKGAASIIGSAKQNKIEILDEVELLHEIFGLDFCMSSIRERNTRL